MRGKKLTHLSERIFEYLMPVDKEEFHGEERSIKCQEFLGFLVIHRPLEDTNNVPPRSFKL